MKVIGIVAEYNPFHNGHKYQIESIKKIYPDSIIIACLSSSFTQRGNISILNKWNKTSVALNNGIDLVIELPYVYSTQSADIFAKNSVKLLNELKVDTLVFGSESNDIDKLSNIAKIQIDNIELDTLVKKYLDEGINYPTALNKAIKELTGNEINDPNDLLAVSYIKEILRNKYNIEPVSIKRTNNYHDLENNSNIVSASNIRNSLKQNKNIINQVPKDVYNILKNTNYDENKYFELLKYKIISEENLSKYVDVTEGIDKRIKKVINESNTLEELIQNIKTKRYTYNKINRMLNHILCSFTNDENNLTKTLEYIRILGFNSKGQEYLNKIKKELSLPILNKYDTKYKSLEIEKRVTSIYSSIFENINDLEIKNKPLYIK